MAPRSRATRARGFEARDRAETGSNWSFGIASKCATDPDRGSTRAEKSDLPESWWSLIKMIVIAAMEADAAHCPELEAPNLDRFAYTTRIAGLEHELERRLF